MEVSTGQEAAVPRRLDPATDRLASVDTLRGVAVLGILAMNIYAFAMPFAAYGDPLLYGGRGIDLATWVFTHLFFDQKFLTIFSALFGAGVVLMGARAERKGLRFAAVLYRRTLWLLLIGLIHAYVFWLGDVLYYYAICGLLLYPMRRLRPRTLSIVGTVLLIVPLLTFSAFGFALGSLRAVAREADRLEAAGETPTEQQRELRERWRELREQFFPDDEQIREDLEIHRDGWTGIAKHRAPTVLTMQTFMMAAFLFWRVAGVMLLGMALMKLGVFSATRSTRFYRNLVLVGYGVGLPIVAFSAWNLFRAGFDPIHVMKIGGHANYAGSLLVAAGHVGVVMLICKGGVLARLRRRLADTGRMALTNYLMHTLLLTSVFYGYGLGLYGHLDRFPQMALVVAVWVLQLWYSSLWLRHFRFGPAEWLWRSLTYWRRQPLRRETGGLLR